MKCQSHGLITAVEHVRGSKVNLYQLLTHALNCMRSTACCRKRYLDWTVRWLSVVACWLNGQGLGLELGLGLGLGPGNALAVLFFSSSGL